VAVVAAIEGVTAADFEVDLEVEGEASLQGPHRSILVRDMYTEAIAWLTNLRRNGHLHARDRRRDGSVQHEQ
jgi:hypothetical protein